MRADLRLADFASPEPIFKFLTPNPNWERGFFVCARIH